MAALVALGFTLVFARSDRICRDVTVSGVAVGGLSRAGARAKLTAWALEQVKQEISLTALDQHWRGTIEQLGARVDTDAAIAKALKVGRSGGFVSRAVQVLTPWGSGKRFSAPIITDSPRAGHTIALIAKQVDRPHQDAKLKAIDGRLEIVPDGYGIKLNKEQAARVVADAISRHQATISLPVETDKPEITANDAVGIDTLLARFTTRFNPGKVGRTHNLVLASRCINGAILKPGMQFSVNKIVGPRLGSRGFRNAPIFVRGKLEDGLGGGICQVSSTLYNAVLLSGLKVLERNHHSRTVPYVVPGRDATVAFGLQDFRFENTNSAPIGILAQVQGSRLTVDIYGAAADKKTISIFTSPSKHIPAGVKTVADASLAPGARKIVDKGASGVSVTVYRRIAQPDGTAKTEVVSRDRYAPQAAIVGVGPIRAASRSDVPATDLAPAASHAN